jgi:NAD(P)-dependent dehydrogenase (short-subunit alcohol dehydrogenase family)
MYKGGRALRTKTTMITGAAGEFGFACAKFLAERGNQLVLLDNNESVKEIANQLPNAISVVGSVNSSHDLSQAVTKAEELFGGVDHLICAAGVVVCGNVEETSESDWRRVLDVNLTGVFLTCQAVLPTMVRQKYGRIVTIASHFGLVAAPRLSAYCTAKAGIIHLTKSIALDYGRQNIRANCLCPGMMKSVMLEQMMERVGRSRDWVETMRYLPLSIPTPDQLVESINYLLSDASQYMTGAVLTIDSGYTLR